MISREGLAFLILFLILLLNLNGICQAGEVKAEILQYKLDRFYIDIGSENYIFKALQINKVLMVEVSDSITWKILLIKQ